jgi:hypothetical protein
VSYGRIVPSLAPEFEYQQIREEIRAEHALISNRLTWYVTSQSFLVSAFAISRGSGFQWYSWFSTLLLPAIGFCATALIFPSIAGAVRTIRIWHARQKEFLARHSEFCAAFDLRRPTWIERNGLLFPRLIPLLFGTFWLVIHVASYFR